VTLALEPGALRVERAGRTERIPYAEVRAVALTYRPTNTAGGAYRARIAAGRRTLTVENLTWSGWGLAGRRDGEYRAFVLDLVSRVKAANPAVVLSRGAHPVRWAAILLFGLAAGLGLAAAIAVAAWRGTWTAALLTTLLLAAFTWQTHALLARNRPGSFDPLAAPQGVLPEA
jgi:hypothetical protein